VGGEPQLRGGGSRIVGVGRIQPGGGVQALEGRGRERQAFGGGGWQGRRALDSQGGGARPQGVTFGRRG
jgi:hypothetical protein